MLMAAWSLTDDDRAQVRHIFLELDGARRGMIQLTELEALLRTKFDFSESEAARAIEVLGRSHGGAIHYSEFLAALVHPLIGLHDDLLRATFRQFDTARCGRITPDSIRQVLGDSFDGFAMVDLLAQATPAVGETPGDATNDSVEADQKAEGVICLDRRHQGLTYEDFASFLRSGASDSKRHREAEGECHASVSPETKRRRTRSSSPAFGWPWPGEPWSDGTSLVFRGGMAESREVDDADDADFFRTKAWRCGAAFDADASPRSVVDDPYGWQEHDDSMLPRGSASRRW